MNKTLSFLVMGALVFGLTCIINPDTTKAQESSLKYVGATKCKMCHNLKSTGKFFDNWLTTKHAQAFFVLKGDERKDPKCLKCHTTGFGKPGGFDPKSPKLPTFAKFEDIKSNSDMSKYLKTMVSNQCENCHGPGEKHIKSKRGKTVIPHEWEPTEQICKKCHNEENPNWNPEKYTDKNGKKTGFDYEQAVKFVNHSKVKEALKK